MTDMTQDELKKVWNEVNGKVLTFSIWEGKFWGASRLICRIQEDYLMRLPAGHDEYYDLSHRDTPYENFRFGRDNPQDVPGGYWKEQIDLLQRQSVEQPIFGNQAKAYDLLKRFMDLNAWHGHQPPACTEERCYEEEIFHEFLKIAEQDLLKDIAGAFGYQITAMQRWEPPYRKQKNMGR
jgi:hypothetical protein